jgi:TonB family protein
MPLPQLRWLAGVVFAIAAMSFVVRAERPTDLRGHPLDTPPRVVKQAKLEYPEMFAVENLAFRGSIIVEFILTENGEVQTPKITQLSHPAFVPPALEALFNTKFSPGLIDGKPVACRFTYLFTFDWEGLGGRGIGVEPFTLPAVSSPGIPEEFRYDVAPRPAFTCEPVYSLELLLKRIEGEAKVNVLIDKKGRVAGAKIVSMTHPEFGAALVAAVEAWRFTPPRKEGRPTITVISREHKFARNNRDLASDADGLRLAGLLRANDASILDVAKLEAPPRLLYDVKPEFPRSLAAQRVTGEATVEFIIDCRGRVRLPRVVNATHTGFGWAAATAVQQRFYEVPRLKNRPVDVRVVETFTFNPAVANAEK